MHMIFFCGWWETILGQFCHGYGFVCLLRAPLTKISTINFNANVTCLAVIQLRLTMTGIYEIKQWKCSHHLKSKLGVTTHTLHSCRVTNHEIDINAVTTVECQSRPNSLKLLGQSNTWGQSFKFILESFKVPNYWLKPLKSKKIKYFK